MTRFDDTFLQRSRERVRALQDRLSQSALEELSREVVLRLASRRRDGDADPDAPEIDALCLTLIEDQKGDAHRMMLDLQARGLSLDQLFTRYLSPAAERLGQMWSDDELTFLQVTLGVGRIYDLVRMLRDHAPPPRVTQAEPVVFASVPGEQHGVGVEMAAELFRQHGWDVKLLIGETHDTILHEIGETRSHVLGLSAGGRASAQPLARLIHAARVAHPHLYIIVSGRIVEAEPDLLALMGPDGAVSTVDEALEMVTRLSGASVQTGD